MRRRAAVEPVIGHLKDDHRLRRHYLKGRAGDRINAVLAAAGYNFSLLRHWFEEFWRALLLLTLRRAFSPPTLRIETFFTDDLQLTGGVGNSQKFQNSLFRTAANWYSDRSLKRGSNLVFQRRPIRLQL